METLNTRNADENHNELITSDHQNKNSSYDLSNVYSSPPFPQNNKQFIIESETEENDFQGDNFKSINGNRILNMNHFLNQLVKISGHNMAFGCSLQNLKLISEHRIGLNSTYFFKCNMCNLVQKISSQLLTEQKANPNSINYQSVLAGISTGIGYRQIEEFLGVIDIPYLAPNTFNKLQKEAQRDIQRGCNKEMYNAAMEAKKIAIEENSVDFDGTPLVCVQIDGCYSKRTYGHNSNYSSLSGVGTIIAQSTKKVIWSAVRNKYCIVCRRAELKTTKPEDHECNSNYAGSSTGMERDALVEGFRKSEELYGIRYHKIIADGDASVYIKILEAKPYKNTHIEKIECRNHLLRNFRKHAKELCTNRTYPITQRKLLGNQINRCTKNILCAIKKRKFSKNSHTTKVEELALDIGNIPFHVFQDHRKCASYFCEQQSLEIPEIYRKFMESELFNAFNGLFKRLKFHARSLVYDVDSNAVEGYNAIVAKTVGGKRINFSRGQSYTSRAKFAVLQHNSQRGHYNLAKYLTNYSPKSRIAKIEIRRLLLNERAITNHPKRRKRKLMFSGEDCDYGNQTCQSLDKSPEEYLELRNDFLKKLKNEAADCHNIERLTLNQSNETKWHEIRMNRLTASKFGEICRNKNRKFLKNKVSNILYSTTFYSKPTIYGLENEKNAIEQFSKENNVEVARCGVFIYQKYPCLAATPDGLIGNDGIIEVKCPYNSKDVHPLDAMKSKLIKFLVHDESTGNVAIKQNHPYYYQIQGQLEITDRDYCFFIVWTPKGLLNIRIPRNAEFFHQNMLQKLLSFYFNSLLKEIIDGRRQRSMPIRDFPENPETDFNNVFD